jgi:hypothetical protein
VSEVLTIPKGPETDPALDQALLFAMGLEHIRALAGKLWSDHNTHDPGVTALELLAYALTDLGYRASFPVEDILASERDNVSSMHAQFFTARRILPNRALTELDYRKLLIDLPDIKNAWVEIAEQRLYADPAAKRLYVTTPGTPGIRFVQIKGLYRVRLELMEHVDPARESAAVSAARARLNANRNLCEDFVDVSLIEKLPFIICGELELDPQADITEIHAQVLFQVEQYLAPPVFTYTLDELSARGMTPEEIFDGPALDNGFILDEELAASDLRKEVRLSDVISIIMDIPGVRAVRELIINPLDAMGPLPDRWLIHVAEGKQPTLERAQSRLVLYKRNVPIHAHPSAVEARYLELEEAIRERLETPRTGARNDLEIPLGRYRELAKYHSFQNHFPAIYGLGPDGLPSGADKAREALALQLKAYLLFFDQLMADFCAQVAEVKNLFSTDPTVIKTYFHQVVDSFQGWQHVYPDLTPAQIVTVLEATDDRPAQVERRNRFLDHLLARYAERFHEYAAITASALGAPPESQIRVKCDFVRQYPEISGGRGLSYDHARPAVWNTSNVSGVEKRVAALIGMPQAERRDLGDTDTTAVPSPGQPDPDEGMLLIESILLRSATWGPPHLPICGDPACTDCAGDDPYSYRVHVLMPAYATRFKTVDFRRFVEDVIRQEMPAHVLPRVCWVSREDMRAVEVAYKAWLEARALGATDVDARLLTLITALYKARNVYFGSRLRQCVPGDERPRFQLGRTPLGRDDER